jgi:hypothetical protein
MFTSQKEYAAELNRCHPAIQITVEYEYPIERIPDHAPFQRIVVGLDPALGKLGFGAYGIDKNGEKVYLVGGRMMIGNNKMDKMERLTHMGDASHLRLILLYAAHPQTTVITWKIEQQRMSSSYNRNIENTNVLTTGALVAAFVNPGEEVELVSAVRKLCKKSVKYYGLDPEDPINIPLKGPKNRVSRKQLGMRCACALTTIPGWHTGSLLNNPFYTSSTACEDLWDVADALLTAVQCEVSKQPAYRPPPKTGGKRGRPKGSSASKPGQQLKKRFKQLVVSDDDE